MHFLIKTYAAGTSVKRMADEPKKIKNLEGEQLGGNSWNE
jgi:hypothetical protein